MKVKPSALARDAIHIELEFRNVGFLGTWEKLENPEKTLSEQGQATTKSTPVGVSTVPPLRKGGELESRRYFIDTLLENLSMTF